MTRSAPMPAASAIRTIDTVRAGSGRCLVRVELAPPVGAGTDVLLVIRGMGEPRRLLPLPTPDGDRHRYAFGVPSDLLEARFALALGETEIPIELPPARRPNDALAAVELERARQRITELEHERERAMSGDASLPPSSAERLERLEEQLAQHRLVRAQLARELEAAREREHALRSELDRARSDVEQAETELARLQEGSQVERAELKKTIDAARARVVYLERRIVEVRAGQPER